ncbi:MAG: PAS domain S-box protein [Ignavibacteria bacterium]|jgi:PAS domain S-box-containing protein
MKHDLTKRSGEKLKPFLIESTHAIAKFLKILSFENSIDRDRYTKIIEKKEKHFREIIEKNADGMIVTDENKNILYFNPAAEKLLSTKAENLIGKKIWFNLNENDITEERIIDSEGNEKILQLKIFEDQWDNKQAKVATLRDITDLINKQKRIEELNLLLKTISSINHLIVTEKSKTKLLEKACELLNTNKNYKSVWIGLFDNDGKIGSIYESGVEDYIDEFREHLNTGAELFCERELLKTDDVFKIYETSKSCGDCPLAKLYTDKGVMAVDISHKKIRYGILVLSKSSNLIHDPEEEKLLSEIADDIGLALYTNDVESQNREAKLKLIDSERFAKSTINALQEHIVVIDDTGKILSANKSWKLFAEENYVDVNKVSEGANYLEVYETASKEGDNFAVKILRNINEVINGNLEGFELEYPCNSPSGKRWFIVNVSSFNGVGPKRIVISHTNITDKKLASIKIKESEDRYRNLYENATVGIYRSTKEGKLLLANPMFLNILGIESVNEFNNNSNLFEIYKDPTDRKVFIEVLEKEQVIDGYDFEIISVNGESKYIRESAKAIKIDNQMVCEGVVQDITKQKQYEKEIVKAKVKAEESDRLKSEFLAQMSHEIRTPLTAISSYASLIGEEFSNIDHPDLKVYLKGLTTAGKRIIRTVESILDISELQSGTYDFNQTEVEVSDILVKIKSDYEEIANEKKLKFTLINNAGSTRINVDKYSIGQVFANLVDNALKYTDEGEVKIIIDRDNNNNLIVELIDTGIGISKEFLPRIFEPFTQEDHGYSRNYDGNGLGMSLVKKYCELNSAEIKVESKKESGTKFRVTFLSQ